MFPIRKTLDEFDFEFHPSIDRAVIEDLGTLRFIHNAENIVLLGPPGVEKTHIAIALGMETVKAGFSVYFINIGILIENLKKANTERMLEKKLRDFIRYKLLIIDEMGHHLDEKEFIAFFRLYQNFMKRVLLSLPQISHMVSGVRYPRTMILHQLFLAGYYIPVLRSTSKVKATG